MSNKSRKRESKATVKNRHINSKNKNNIRVTDNKGHYIVPMYKYIRNNLAEIIMVLVILSICSMFFISDSDTLNESMFSESITTKVSNVTTVNDLEIDGDGFWVKGNEPYIEYETPLDSYSRGIIRFVYKTKTDHAIRLCFADRRENYIDKNSMWVTLKKDEDTMQVSPKRRSRSAPTERPFRL